MIQTLQRRFILTAMIAISVFVLVLLGVTNGMNAFSTYRQNVDILDELCDSAVGGHLFYPENVGAATVSDATPAEIPPESIVPESAGKRRLSWFGVDLIGNYRQSAVYFVVSVTPEWTIHSINPARLGDDPSAQVSELAALQLRMLARERTGDSYGKTEVCVS